MSHVSIHGYDLPRPSMIRAAAAAELRMRRAVAVTHAARSLDQPEGNKHPPKPGTPLEHGDPFYNDAGATNNPADIDNDGDHPPFYDPDHDGM